MAHAESRRGRRARPPALGRGGTGARPLHAGRSSCGRCSIRRRPAPGCLPCSPGSWVAIMPPAPAPSIMPPWGLLPRRCTYVPPFRLCSRFVPAPWNTVSPLSLLGWLMLSFPLFQINRNRYREERRQRDGGAPRPGCLCLWRTEHAPICSATRSPSAACHVPAPAEQTAEHGARSEWVESIGCQNLMRDRDRVHGRVGNFKAHLLRLVLMRGRQQRRPNSLGVLVPGCVG